MKIYDKKNVGVSGEGVKTETEDCFAVLSKNKQCRYTVDH